MIPFVELDPYSQKYFFYSKTLIRQEKNEKNAVKGHTHIWAVLQGVYEVQYLFLHKSKKLSTIYSWQEWHNVTGLDQVETEGFTLPLVKLDRSQLRHGIFQWVPCWILLTAIICTCIFKTATHWEDQWCTLGIKVLLINIYLEFENCNIDFWITLTFPFKMTWKLTL